MVEKEVPLSVLLACRLFHTRNQIYGARYEEQPFLGGLLDIAGWGDDLSLRLKSVKFFLHDGKLETENGNSRRAYLKGKVLTLEEFGKEVFISLSRLTKRKIALLKETGFAAIFGPPPELPLVSFPIAERKDHE